MDKTEWAGVAWALVVGGAGAHDAQHGAGFAIGVIALAPLAVALAASRLGRKAGTVRAVEAEALAWTTLESDSPAQPGLPARPLASPRPATPLSWTFS